MNFDCIINFCAALQSNKQPLWLDKDPNNALNENEGTRFVSGVWSGKWRAYWPRVETDAKWEYSACQCWHRSSAWGHHPPSAHLEGRKTERAVSEWVVSFASAVAILWPRWQFDCFSHPLLYPTFLVVFNQQPLVLSERLPGHLMYWAALQRPLLAMTSVSSPH